MEKNLVRSVVISLILALGVVLAPAPAQALNIDPNISTGTGEPAPAPPPSGGGLSNALSSSAPNLLQTILCPLATGVAAVTSPVPGVGPLVDQLPMLVCSVGILGYAYRTIYIPTNGPKVVRYTKAIAGVPTLLDVDGVGLPDFVGSINPNLALNGINLNVQRTNGFPASAKVAVEAVLINPATPNSYVGFGPDGTKSGTASNWTARMSVFGLSSTTVDLGLDILTNNAPASLTAIGELLSGPNPDAPEKTFRGAAAFTPVPAAFKTRLIASQDRQQVIVNSTPTKLAAQVSILSPGRDQRIGLTADQLPSTIDIVHTSAGGTETTTYDASGPIAKLTGGYRDMVGNTIATAAALDAWGVPAHIKFAQTAEKTVVGATQGGKFDRIQARFARGGDIEPLDPALTPFARFHRTTATNFTGTLQLNDLQSVEINQGAPYGGRLTFATAPGLFPFTADDDVTSTHLEGSLSNLPADTSVSVDLDNGKVIFDGHGTGINQIKVKATRPQSSPFFAQVSRLEATLDGLPAYEEIDIKQENGGVRAEALNPLGTITLLASNGAGAPAINGSVASYVDNGSTWRAFLRMSGLKSVGFQPNPLTADLQTSAPQVFRVNGDAGGITFDGTINQLPSHLTFSMADTGPAQQIDFNSHGEEIGAITVNGTGLPAPALMPNFEATIEDLPSHLTLTLPESSGNVKLDMHGDHITRVYAQAFGNGQHVNVGTGRHRLEYVENSHVAVNLRGVGSAEFGMSGKPIHLKYDISSDPLDYKVVATGVDLGGVISNPQPATIDIDSFDKAVDGEGGVTVQYHVDPANHTGDGSIDSITLKGVIGSSFLDTTVTDIPANLDICLQSTDGLLCKPTYVPGAVILDGEHRDVPAPAFAFHFFPTNLAGNVPSEPVHVGGQFCPETASESTCSAGAWSTKRVLINDLRFKTVEAAFGAQDAGCDLACGTIWAAANTAAQGSPPEGDHINGRVRYWNGDTDLEGDPLLDLDLSADADFISFNKLFLIAWYDAFDLELDVGSVGTFTCGDDPSLTIGINNMENPDILSGLLGICP